MRQYLPHEPFPAANRSFWWCQGRWSWRCQLILPDLPSNTRGLPFSSPATFHTRFCRFFCRFFAAETWGSGKKMVERSGFTCSLSTGFPYPASVQFFTMLGMPLPARSPTCTSANIFIIVSLRGSEMRARPLSCLSRPPSQALEYSIFLPLHALVAL